MKGNTNINPFFDRTVTMIIVMTRTNLLDYEHDTFTKHPKAFIRIQTLPLSTILYTYVQITVVTYKILSKNA